ncbi:ABC transporter family substrate-binding protein [Luteimicrobium subarcticum]|uniref:Peptide/nickel transport system substrate-binding protein n=1 Tax=Luteimicrobium subarcticum TaxID=620910 RepID=A0A2M8WUM6_9MICO|nr:ABC transporter family substrate-binding protein [Luteimicrobium subarcticum]PJI94642.1 peptide/nickel transport system substrate-binding protein [Luteimicrobium subarcticum]
MRITRKAAAAAAVVAAGALALSACSSSSGDNKSDDSDNAGINTNASVNIAWNQPFYSYNGNSITGNATANNVVLYLTDSSFYYYDKDLKIVHDTSFGSYEKVSDDPLKVKYTFADDNQWSDGVKASPADLLLEWAAQSGKYNTVEKKTDEEGNTTNQGALNKGVYFDGADPGKALIKDVPEIDGNSITFTYSKPFADWEVNFSTFLPAHVVAERALGVTDPQQATDQLVKAVQDDDKDALSKIAKSWSDDFNYTSLPSDDNLYVANGAYKISKFVKDQYVTLVANDKYTGDRKATIPTVTIRWNGDPMGQVQALQNGEVDVINPQSTADVLEALKKTSNLTTETGDEATYEHVDLQQGNGGPFDPKSYGGDADKALKVRQAFLKSIPREQIVDQLIKPLNPQAAVRNSYTVTPGSPSYDQVSGGNGMADQQALDIDGAKSLLKDAGVTKAVKVRLLFDPENTRRVNEYQLIAASAKKAGFDVEPYKVQTDWGTDLSNATTYYDAALFGWQSQSTAVTESDANYRTGGANNYYGYSNKQVDTLFDQLQVATDPAKQADILAQVEKLLVDDAFGTTIFQFPGVFSWNPEKISNVQHLTIAPTVFYDFWEWKGGTAPAAS